MVLDRRPCVISREPSGGNIVHEEGREMIRLWKDSSRRLAKKSCPGFWVYSINLETLRQFFLNFNFMVIIQLVLAVISVLVFQMSKLSFEIQLPLLVSPVVFPLAFSIVTDFQRREKVLEDMGLFKSSTMMWYFCMREWQRSGELDIDWLVAVHAKLKSLLFHLHEYLLTNIPERREMIVRVIYEDFSDASQLIELVRESKIPANTALVSRAIHLISMACLSFERLRVVREYRSPRSIRSFNKVFIMLFPIILAPHFIHETEDHAPEHKGYVWRPYYMTIIVTIVFSILQGVQDKLDDPFDGLSEDDINLDKLDKWTSSCVMHTKDRRFDIARYKDKAHTKGFTNDVNSPLVTIGRRNIGIDTQYDSEKIHHSHATGNKTYLDGEITTVDDGNTFMSLSGHTGTKDVTPLKKESGHGIVKGDIPFIELGFTNIIADTSSKEPSECEYNSDRKTSYESNTKSPRESLYV